MADWSRTRLPRDKMRELFRKYEEDWLYFAAGVCLIGAGAMTGIVLADIALHW